MPRPEPFFLLYPNICIASSRESEEGEDFERHRRCLLSKMFALSHSGGFGHFAGKRQENLFMSQENIHSVINSPLWR